MNKQQRFARRVAAGAVPLLVLFFCLPRMYFAGAQQVSSGAATSQRSSSAAVSAAGSTADSSGASSSGVTTTGIASLTSPSQITSYRILTDDAAASVSLRTRLQYSIDNGTNYFDVTNRPGGQTTLIALGWDHSNPARIAVTTADYLYLSEDGGSSWREIAPKGQVARNVKLTAIALSPLDPKRMLLGTSFDGFYESGDSGKTWVQVSDAKPLQFFERGAGFTEEVSAVSYDATDPDLISFTLGFGYGTYTYNLRSHDVVRVGGGSLPNYSAKPATIDSAINNAVVTSDSPPAIKRLVAARDRTGIYVSPVNARTDRIGTYIALAKQQGFNSIVVDFKDDFGYLRYASENPIAKSIGAVRPLFDAKNLVAQAHAAGIYVIARMVTFKDEQLYGYQDHKYALWDSERNAPWGVFRQEEVPVATSSAQSAGSQSDSSQTQATTTRTVQVEYWVDPYSSFVWDYNISLAKEIQDLGVDEIQFDYIRFPSDGNVSAIQARFRPDGMDRVQALSSFLSHARNALTVPISIDVYGFNAWYRTNYLGQDVEELSRYVDVICPMFYPSHFTRSFYGSMSYLDRAKFIYREGSNRAQSIVGSHTIIRPWVQSFLIGGELKFDTDTYSQYLIDQLQGAKEGSASGFTLWNASGHYYMITTPLTDYTAGR